MEENLVWKTELPGGSPASPVLVGDRLFVLSDPALLLCLDASSGKVLWQRGHTAAALGDAAVAEAGDAAPTHNPDGNAGSAASTPVCDGRFVYAMFANGIVSAHGLDGKRRWVRFIEKPKTTFGHASSPVLAGGRLIVQFRDLVALDAGTGKDAWRAGLPVTHASPAVTRVGDVDLLVHPSGSILRARDGHVVAQGLFQLRQSSPVVDGQVIYANEKGKLKALRLPDSVGETLDVKLLWDVPVPRGQYQIASPVVHDGCIYTISLNGSGSR